MKRMSGDQKDNDNNDTERETRGDGAMQVESDCSSSRAAIDCSSWQRRLYQQSERFTV